MLECQHVPSPGFIVLVESAGSARHVGLQCNVIDLQQSVSALGLEALSLQQFCVCEKCQLRNRDDDEIDM